MELSWSTFLLEIINFLVLVWILSHFLYRPVLKIIEKRRNDIDLTLTKAEQLRKEADNLQQQYEGRLADWELEKQHAREKLQNEMQVERKKLYEDLNRELTTEREKAIVIAQRHQAETKKREQEKAMRQGARFAAKLLQSVASPELENSLFELLLTLLSQLSDEQKENIRQSCKSPIDRIIINSAFQLSNKQKQKLAHILQDFCDSSIPLEYTPDSSLLAGLRITLGSWVLRMNLQDELTGFAVLNYE